MSDDGNKDKQKKKVLTKADLKPHVTCEYPLPTCQDYLSYYVYQTEWRPTKSIGLIGAMSSSPGPAVVNLPSTMGEDGANYDITRPKPPSYKIGIRLPGGKIQGGPGPGKYDIRDMSSQGVFNPKAPKIGKANRFSERERMLKSMSPGPAKYTRAEGDEQVYSRAPAYSMPHSERAKMRIPQIPAPNAYTLPHMLGPGNTPILTGPHYSIGKSKRPGLGGMSQSPGPAQYNATPTDVNLPRAPGYTIRMKTKLMAGKEQSPGPAMYYDYLVKYDRYSGPRPTFGIRHSPYKVQPGFAQEK